MWSSTFHTLAVIALTDALDTMLGFAIGIRVEFGSRRILNGAGISAFAKRSERRRGAVVCLMGLLKKERLLGCYFLFYARAFAGLL